VDRATVEYVGIIVGIIVGVIGIGATIRAIVLWFHNRAPRPTVSMCIAENFAGNPAVFLKIVNDSAAELNIVQPAELLVDDPRYPPTDPRQLHHEKVEAGSTAFPRSLRKQGRVIFYESMSQLADDLRMRDCWEDCLVRGVFRDTLDHRLQSARYVFPVKYWLASDASALRHTPAGPQRFGIGSRLRTWWELRRARTIHNCPRWT
jgi:hypothetical protein